LKDFFVDALQGSVIDFAVMTIKTIKRNMPVIVLSLLLAFSWLSLMGRPVPALAEEEAHYKVAKECAAFALPEEEYYKFTDKLMADMVRQQVANSPKLLNHETIIMKIYQEGTRDYLGKIGAVENTWDKAARRLMAEFSERELQLVSAYQHQRIGRDFLTTETGQKWQEKADAIVLDAVAEVRQGFDSKFDLYGKIIQEKIDSYKAQGELPADL
jgi:hypothetical protein